MKITLKMYSLRILYILFIASGLVSCKKDIFTIPKDVELADPCIFKQKDTYYIFSTGGGIVEWTSADLINWTEQKNVFDTIPGWIYTNVPGFQGSLWAPDISYYNGQYYLYYCASVIGTNGSVIGVATNKTLDRADPDYHWVDHGMVIKSVNGVTPWNALDPNLITDNNGSPYLAYGSFWEGIKLAKLNPDRLSISSDLSSLPTIGSRSVGFDTDVYGLGPSNNPIEGSFIYKRKGFYYLFASIGYAGRGAASSYKIVVGLSKSISGPYIDEKGIPLTNGGGTVIRAGDNDWYAVGHNAVANFDGTDYIVYFAYDKADNAKAKLRIEKLVWPFNAFPKVITR